jgi:2'-5' RNA ligase
VHWVVELYVDRAAEGAIRALQRTPRGGDSRPHVSLAAYDQLDTARCREVVAAFAAGQPSLDVTFASWGAFPAAEPVLFLAPVVTDGLLALHRALHDRLAAFGAGDPYCRPDAWVPHCTLAIGLPTSELPSVADACRHALPIHGRLESIALVEYQPRREIGAFDLRSDSL